MSVPFLVKSILVILLMRGTHERTPEKVSVLPPDACMFDNPPPFLYTYSGLFQYLCMCFNTQISKEKRTSLDIFCHSAENVTKELQPGYKITNRDIMVRSKQSVPILPKDIGEHALQSTKCQIVSVKCLCFGEEAIYYVLPEERNTSNQMDSVCYLDHEQTCLDRHCIAFERREGSSTDMSSESRQPEHGSQRKKRYAPILTFNNPLESKQMRRYENENQRRNLSEHSGSTFELDSTQVYVDRNCTTCLENVENRSKEMSPWSRQLKQRPHKKKRHAHRKPNHKPQHQRRRGHRIFCKKPRGNKYMRCFENEYERICLKDCYAAIEITIRYMEQRQFDVFKCKFREDEWHKLVIACDCEDLCQPTANHFCYERNKDTERKTCFGLCLKTKKKHQYPYLYYYNCKDEWYSYPKSMYCRI